MRPIALQLAFAVVTVLALACGPDRRGGGGQSSSASDGGDTCTPECGSRECGVDPVCGKSCGTCGAGLSCNDVGLCTGTPAECLVDTPCVGNGDCPSGYRCNRGMQPPQCHELYCAPQGGACDEEFFCTEGLHCIAGRCGQVLATNVTGTVMDTAVTYVDAVFFEGASPSMLLSTDPDVCARQSQNRTRVGERTLWFLLPMFPGPGSHDLREATATVIDAQCEADDSYPRVYGTLEIFAVDSEEILGRLSLDNGAATLSGVIRARACSGWAGGENVCE